MQTVIISCIPQLNQTQQQGLLNLVHNCQAQGLKVYVWTDFDYEILQPYRLNYSSYPRLKAYLFYIQIRLKLNTSKWLQRLQLWMGTTPKGAKKQFDRYLKECIKIFTAVKPAYFICWNPWCCRFGIAHDAARLLNIKTAALEWGFLPDTFILDKGTLAASKIFSTNPLANYSQLQLQQFTATGQVIFEELKSKSLSLYTQQQVEIPADFTVNDIKIIKLLVLGIDEVDSGAYPPQHPDRLGLLPFHESSYAQAMDIAAANPAYRVIYKPHPSHNRYSTNSRQSGNMAVVNGNPDELIDWADAVFCSGSKMEFSVILKNKPLLTYGAGLLYGKGCSYEVEKPQDMQQQLKLALSGANNHNHKANFITFLGYLSTDYLYHYRGDKDKVEQVLHGRY